MSAPVRIALIGNSFAQRVQLPALRWAGGNTVVAIAGADAAKARATADAFGIPRATGDWRELLDDPGDELDLVIVSTPVYLHHPMVSAFLERTSAAILCEKPFALDKAEAGQLVARAEGRGAWVDHQLRFAPALRAVRDRVRAGDVGRPWNARVELAFTRPGQLTLPHRWWYEAEKGGGMLGALGSHLVDLLRWILADEVEALRCHLDTFVTERVDAAGQRRAVTADEHVLLDLRFRAGTLGEVRTSSTVPAGAGLCLQVAGDGGVLRLERDEHLSFAAAPGAAFEPVSDLPVLESCAQYGMQGDHGLFGRALPLFLRELIRTLQQGGTQLADAATFADGLAVQRLLDAARRSAGAHGGWLFLS